jgi:pimeloyl-ACP methyl ester carboxylesterase
VAKVNANGIRLNVQRLAPAAGAQPGAPIVVTLHGMLIDNLSSFYFSLGTYLANEGCDVVCYDLRGHGYSERTPDGYDMETAQADLSALLDALAIDRPVHLIGNSYGATLALAYGLAHPERVASLTLVEPPFLIEGLGEEMERSLTEILAAVSRDDVEMWLAEDAGRAVARTVSSARSMLTDTTIRRDMLATRPFSRARLANLGAPVLAVYGANSDIIGQAENLAAAVPDCTLVVLKKHTHSVLREATDYLRDLTRWWLTGRASTAMPVYDPPAGPGFFTPDWVRDKVPPADLRARAAAAGADAGQRTEP